jgi:nucleoside-diphosphate-sugar epimerase
MATYSVRNHAPYYAMPTYSPDLKGLTAVVFGANGISGQAMVTLLSENPERWTKVYALSRKPPSVSWGRNVQHVSVDLLKPPQEIADILKASNVKADYAFFFAYTQPSPPLGQPLWSNAKELSTLNNALLANSLEALHLAGSVPKRISLQTGSKHYGMHLGAVAIPYIESDPRVTIDDNFYYPQEDNLAKFSSEHQTSFNVVRPVWILGATKDAAMNMLYPLSVYAAVQSYLGKPLDFPGDVAAWENEKLQSSASMNSYFHEWLVLNPNVANEAFNITDDYRFNWSRFWPILASWYGAKWNPPTNDESKYTEISAKHNPRQYGTNAKIRFTYTLTQWAMDPSNQAAWKEIAAKEGITHNPFDDLERVWTPTNFALIGSSPITVSSDKARKAGWNGYADTHAIIKQVFEKMAEDGITPRLRN